MTAFTAIIMPILILLVLVLSDIYIARNAKQAAENALKASCGCVLSQYSSYMKDEYALYGYQMSDQEAKSIVLETLNKSAISNGLYRMDIEDIEVQRIEPIQDYMVLSSQIMEVMQEDIFATIIKETNERIKIFTKMKDVLRTLNIKIQVDELIGGIKNAHESLKETTLQINTSPYYYDLLDMVNTIEDIYQRVLNLLEASDQEQSQIQIDSLKQEALYILKMNMDNLVYVLKEYNKEGISLVKEMTNTYMQVHILSESMSRLTTNIKDCPEYLQALLTLCINRVYEMENSFSQAIFDHLESTLNRNVDCLDSLVLEITNAVLDSKEISIKQVFNEAMEEYYDAIYETVQLDNFFFSVFDKDYEDQRSFLKQYAQELLSKISLEDNIIEPFVSLISDNLDTKFYFAPDLSGSSLKSIFSSLDDICDLLSKLKQDVFFNEYVVLHLSNLTSNLQDGYIEKYLKCETEYIIFGNRDNNKNIKSCKASITAIRFACNAIHVYTDFSKTSKANGLAAALAGSWTFGVATPIAKNLILCSWAYAESAYDTNALCKGTSCPVYKLDGDWKLDIGVAPGFNKTCDWLKIDYEDYMRIMLCMTSNELKARRLLDVISLNAPCCINMEEVFCGVNIKAQFSYKGILGIERHFELQANDAY